MRARATLIATAAVVSLAGCKDSGLPDRNLPFDEAAHRPPDALVQAVHPETRPGAGMPDDPAHAGVSMATRPVTIGEQTFAASGRPVDVGTGSLRQVGGMGGMSFFAAMGDDAPYDQLYMQHGEDGGYIVYTPMHDATGDPAARQSVADRGLEEGPAAH